MPSTLLEAFGAGFGVWGLAPFWRLGSRAGLGFRVGCWVSGGGCFGLARLGVFLGARGPVSGVPHAPPPPLVGVWFFASLVLGRLPSCRVAEP